jgi:hypothetical protein
LSQTAPSLCSAGFTGYAGTGNVTQYAGDGDYNSVCYISTEVTTVGDGIRLKKMSSFIAITSIVNMSKFRRSEMFVSIFVYL